MKNDKYFIGLDIGTNSVGWSVTDQENNLVKFKGNNMWGVRLFEAGQTAEARRIYRCTRRRYDRRRYRLELLRQIIGPEIEKVDFTFFMRLNEAFLHKEDRKNKNKYNLFIDEDFNDIHYYKKYPTIYHLRKYLIETDEKADIRLIYLALHHIIKYRGHFLYENQVFDIDNIDLEGQIIETLELLGNIILLDSIKDINVKNIARILKDKELTRKKKSDLIIEHLKPAFVDQKQLRHYSYLISGCQSEVDLLFPNLDLDNESKKMLKLSFSTSKYDDNKDEIDSILDEEAVVLEKIKELYNSVLISSLFGDTKTKYISDVMVTRYEKHNRDLNAIRRLLREHYKEDYKKIFKEKSIGKNYYTYINAPKKLSCDDLTKEIKKMIITKDLVDNEDYQYCLKQIEKEDFLLRINTVENSAYPYQINLIELEKIVDNQSKYYPILNSITNDGQNKIAELFKFRIPYYVGPLNTYNPNGKSFGWLIKYNNEKIDPWNFKKVVNSVESARKFITRMTSQCTYLMDQTVIPKNSLLYTKFMVLNELKNIKVNGRRLPLEVESKIMKELFIDSQKLTIKKSDLMQWLIRNKIYPSTNLEITGFAKKDEFLSNLKPYIDFIKILGEINTDNIPMIEELIYWLTIYEDREIVLTRIKKEYPKLDDDIIKRILSLKYSGWSRLSRKLLTEDFLCDKRTGEMFSIMKLLKETKSNFMQIISDRNYNFDEVLERENYRDVKGEITYDDIKSLVCSPAIKKGIWQSILIIKEIINIMGKNPENIFIEMTRSEGKKGRTDSRKDQLKKLYDKLFEDNNNYFCNKIECNNLVKQLDKVEDKLDQRKYFLYFLQQGKCLYSGAPLNIYDIAEYEIDHIIPRSLVKDDSFDNLALVCKNYNQLKSDNLTLKKNIIVERKEFWNYLLKYNFISVKKYNNLIREDYRKEDIAGFINRQIVETSQINKHVMNLINKWFEYDIVVCIRSKLISDFRNKYEIYKIRELNNLHHAQDAYLCSVIGNYILTRYPSLKDEFVYNNYLKYKNDWLKRGFGFVINNMEKDFIDNKGRLLIDANHWIQKIIKVSSYQDMLVTRKIEKRTGEFYDQNASPKGKNLSPIKEHLDPQKYGGYSKRKEAYSTLIKYRKNQKEILKMIGIPVMVDKKANGDIDIIKQYIKEATSLEQFEIVKNNIRKNQLIEFKGQLCCISSANEIFNAVELKISKQYHKFLDAIYKQTPKQELELVFNKYEQGFLDEILFKIENHFPLLESEYIKIKKFYDNRYYSKLTIEDKIKFIKAMLRIAKANYGYVDLTYFNTNDMKFGTEEGRKKVSNICNGVFVDTSITGLFRRKYEF